jgi:hypothetical protein
MEKAEAEQDKPTRCIDWALIAKRQGQSLTVDRR